MKSISKLLFILAVIFLLIICGAGSDDNEKVTNNYETSSYDVKKIDNLTNIQQPIQEIINNQKKEEIMVGNKKVTIVKLATYDISGVVVQTNKHDGEVGSFDVALAWGIFTVDDNYKKVKVWNSGKRQITFNAIDTEWFQSVGGINNLRSKMSNNHLIASNENLEKLFKKIKIGNYIRIKGYLVTASWDNTTWGPSSLSRDDADCEIIYVEDLEWLK